MNLDFDVPGHPRWLALPLEGDADEQARAYVQQVYDPDVDQEVLAQTVAVVAGMSRLVRRSAEDGPPTAAAWTLLPPSGEAAPGPLALLRYLPLPENGTDDDAIELLLDPADEHWGPIDVADLETASGRALSLRFRPVVVRDGDRQVHELRAVLWPRPAAGLALVLSVYVVDLLAGAEVGGPLEELGASVVWSTG
ncbi:MAG TPA: hypothetical protein VFR07_12580 [Mycobacteriales bacterium]|nr:hypothetical protein [Mycobacteriales bacterium]